MNNSSSSDRQTVSDRLNQTCFCVTLDRMALYDALEREAGDAAFRETFVLPRSHLFSNVPVFLSAGEVAEMQAIVKAIEATSKLAAYRATVVSWAPALAEKDHGPVGSLMGYDFHLSADGRVD